MRSISWEILFFASITPRLIGGTHHRFEDVAKWVERFEDPERDEWQKPEVVVRCLDLKGNEIVADIGSATGYFPLRFAKKLCPTGRFTEWTSKREWLTISTTGQNGKAYQIS